ncbi:MAG: NnrU family protein [Vicinamibacterales bacterium]
MSVLFRYVGFGLFMGAIALTGWWWLSLPTLAGANGGIRAAAVDLALFAAFALHHSVFARPAARAWVSRWLPDDLVRSAYVWVASLLLMGMCLSWQPIGRDIYRTTGIVAGVSWLTQIVGVVVSLAAIRRIRVGELGGLTEPRPSEPLQYAGPYRLVRHPLYLGWVLIVVPAAHMTGDRLLFAVASTIYLVLAMPLEEAGLVRQFGERYLDGPVAWCAGV